jgi:hypothetical protein
MVYISLDKEYLEENKERMNKEAIDELGEDGKDVLLYIDNRFAEVDEINENLILTANCNSDIAYISVDIKLKDEDILRIIELVAEKFEKYKEAIRKLSSILKDFEKLEGD